MYVDWKPPTPVIRDARARAADRQRHWRGKMMCSLLVIAALSINWRVSGVDGGDGSFVGW